MGRSSRLTNHDQISSTCRGRRRDGIARCSRLDVNVDVTRVQRFGRHERFELHSSIVNFVRNAFQHMEKSQSGVSLLCDDKRMTQSERRRL